MKAKPVEVHNADEATTMTFILGTWHHHLSIKNGINTRS